MADEFRERFLTLLHNQPTDGSDGGMKPRSRGFVVFVPGNKSLAPLQEICDQQSYNDCFTARYRVAAGAVFGTVFSALLRDILTPSDASQSQGLFLPALDPELVSDTRKTFGSILPIEDLVMEADTLSQESIQRLLEVVQRLTDEAVGKRFVLFCEVIGEFEDIEEWEIARALVFSRLPERVGIVISGVPEDFALIRDNTSAEAMEKAPTEALEESPSEDLDEARPA